MATVTVTQPAYGYTSTKNSSMSGYTVQWYANDSGVAFYGFRVICHACEGTLYSSSNNPASFDLSSLEDSGHPGPFEIVTDVGSPPPAEVWLTVTTYAVDAKGTTSPASRTYTTTSGGTVKVTIDAAPNAGYRFKEWRLGSPTGTVVSTDSHYQTTIRLYGSGGGSRHYYAIFEDTSLIPVVASIERPDNYFGPNVVVGGVVYYWGRVASSSTSNIVRAYYSNTGPGGGDKVINIANLTTSPAYKGANTGVIYPGQTLSINYSVTNAPVYEGFGLQVDRVEVVESGFFGGSENRETRTYTYGGGSGSVSLSHVVSADLAGDIGSSVVNVVVYLVFDYCYRKVVFTVVGDDLSRPFLRVSTGENAGTAFAEPGAHSVSIWVLDSYYNSRADGKVEFGGYLARDRAFVHGWSVPVSGSGNNRYLIIHNVPAGTVIYVTVYICTHLLVCTDDGLYLECKPPELLCDCSVPPGTTVYP